MKHQSFRTTRAAALAALLAASLQTQAQDAELRLREVRLWAASCAACHGTDGRSEGASLRLAGKPSDYLYDNLIAFKTGTRAATVMHQHARGYSDQELRRLADHFGGIR